MSGTFDWNEVTKFVDRLMAEGKASEVKGWTMLSILDKVEKRWGEGARWRARQYVLDLRNLQRNQARDMSAKGAYSENRETA